MVIGYADRVEEIKLVSLAIDPNNTRSAESYAGEIFYRGRQ